MRLFVLGSKGHIAVENSETVCNVILASDEAIKKIALNAKKILEQTPHSIMAVIDEKIYNQLCEEYEIGCGFTL